MDMPTIRAKYPQYSDLSDEELAQGLHKANYSDMPYGEFTQKIGLSQKQPEKGLLGSLYDATTSRETAQILGGAIGSAVSSPSGPPGMVVGGSLGAGAGGQIHDFITGNVGTGGEQALKAGFDVGTDALMGAVAPKVLQAGSAVVKQGLAPLAKGVARGVTGTRGIGARDLAQIEAMERLGMKIDASHLDSPTAQRMGISMRQNPGSDRITKYYRKLQKRIKVHGGA